MLQTYLLFYLLGSVWYYMDFTFHVLVPHAELVLKGLTAFWHQSFSRQGRDGLFVLIVVDQTFPILRLNNCGVAFAAPLPSLSFFGGEFWISHVTYTVHACFFTPEVHKSGQIQSIWFFGRFAQISLHTLNQTGEPGEPQAVSEWIDRYVSAQPSLTGDYIM